MLVVLMTIKILKLIKLSNEKMVYITSIAKGLLAHCRRNRKKYFTELNWFFVISSCKDSVRRKSLLIEVSKPQPLIRKYLEHSIHFSKTLPPNWVYKKMNYKTLSCRTYECVHLANDTTSVFLRLYKFQNMFHHGSAGGVQNKECYFTLSCFFLFWPFFVAFHHEKYKIISISIELFHFFFDEVSSFGKEY